jgi:predicted nuclease with TOPRIM domain
MSAQSLGGQSGAGVGGLDGLSTELQTIAVLCSAVPEIDEDLRALADRVEALDGSIDELNDDTSDLQAEIGELSEALRQLTGNVADLEETVEEELDDLRSRQDDLAARLDAVEGCLNPDLLEKQTAHVEAQDSSMPFNRGDERELVVEEVQGRPDATLRGKIEKVQTFVDVDDPTEYEEGDLVNVTITDLNGTAAHAAPTETFEE